MHLEAFDNHRTIKIVWLYGHNHGHGLLFELWPEVRGHDSGVMRGQTFKANRKANVCKFVEMV